MSPQRRNGGEPRWTTICPRKFRLKRGRSPGHERNGRGAPALQLTSLIRHTLELGPPDWRPKGRTVGPAGGGARPSALVSGAAPAAAEDTTLAFAFAFAFAVLYGVTIRCIRLNRSYTDEYATKRHFQRT